MNTHPTPKTIVPYKGWSMDDAIVISDSYAKRMAAEQTLTHHQEFDDQVKGGLHHFVSLFPTAFKKDQLANFDEHGVVKPGTIVKQGDPLILATAPKTVTSADVKVGKLSRVLQTMRRNASQTWDNEDDGEVTDVAHGRKGVKVIVRSVSAAKPGDKIVFRSGPGCFDDKTELLTERGWTLFKDLSDADRVASLFEDGLARFVQPFVRVTYAYEGDMYGCRANYVNYKVTPSHRVWSRGHTKACCQQYHCTDARRVHGVARKFQTAATFDIADRKDPEWFELPAAPLIKSNPRKKKHATRFRFADFVEFMGYYLADGNLRWANKGDYRIVITQGHKANHHNCVAMEELFTRMGVRWRYSGAQFYLEANKSLWAYLQQFGKAVEKFVPEFILRASRASLERFLWTLWRCDGHHHIGGHFKIGKQYYTSSRKLADGVEHILAILGYAFSETTRDRNPAREWTPAITIQLMPQAESGTRKNYQHAYFKEHYKGTVYCVQVPGFGVVCTRRENVMLWSGNSIVSKTMADKSVPRKTSNSIASAPLT